MTNMNLSLIKQLQSINLFEEDLFPNVSREELERRNAKREAELKTLFDTIAVGDTVKVREENRDWAGYIGKVIWLEATGGAPLFFQVQVEFTDREGNIEEVFFSPEELEKVEKEI